MQELTIALVPPGDLTRLGEQWRDLEARACGSFFTGWTWVGCRLTERYRDPLLLRACRGDRVVALALCNRRRGWTRAETVWIGETGEAAHDTV
ncbi:MAG: GNAT family N-acetyltransferase, partial [Acetobacteraceae bacterium]|nr:GNAT family N-acetyltransferase [Acetobacteraceae bacterium]